jgi:hypothetical protein
MTLTRLAACSCGQLTARVSGEPVRVSICHCLACQRRTGGPFAEQARYLVDEVAVAGVSTSYIRTGDEGTHVRFTSVLSAARPCITSPQKPQRGSPFLSVRSPIRHSRHQPCRSMSPVCTAGLCLPQALSTFPESNEEKLKTTRHGREGCRTVVLVRQQVELHTRQGRGLL